MKLHKIDQTILLSKTCQELVGLLETGLEFRTPKWKRDVIAVISLNDKVKKRQNGHKGRYSDYDKEVHEHPLGAGFAHKDYKEDDEYSYNLIQQRVDREDYKIGWREKNKDNNHE